jgi:hypothetical protein
VETGKIQVQANVVHCPFTEITFAADPVTNTGDTLADREIGYPFTQLHHFPGELMPYSQRGFINIKYTGTGGILFQVRAADAGKVNFYLYLPGFGGWFGYIFKA